jgi:hypothetical protein
MKLIALALLVFGATTAYSQETVFNNVVYMTTAQIHTLFNRNCEELRLDFKTLPTVNSMLLSKFVVQ